MFIASICNILQLVSSLLLRILSVGLSLDYTRTSHIWCKTRVSLAMSVLYIASFSICLSTIDQFLITSRDVHIRQISQIKLAH
ncbi:hypothetical protein I4U23_027310 [Adineta vaga]|nr:hypothetical protein I4U23_027310 [Adineta vaga]